MSDWLEVACPICGHYHSIKGADRINPDRELRNFGRKMRSDGRGSLQVVETYEHPSEHMKLSAAWKNRVVERIVMVLGWLTKDSFIEREELIRLFQRVHRKLNVWTVRWDNSMKSDSIRAEVSSNTHRRSIDD